LSIRGSRSVRHCSDGRILVVGTNCTGPADDNGGTKPEADGRHAG
jgi:hypothetical protein